MSRGQAIAGALAKVSTTVDEIGPENWRLTLTNGSAIAARAHIDDAWLVITARQAPGPSHRPWSLLEWNGALPGGVRLALARRSGELLARADVTLDPERGLGSRIDRACTDLKAAAGVLVDPLVQPPDPSASGSEDRSREILALCEETGWPARARDDGQVLVDLEVPGAFHQALVGAGTRGAVRVAVPVLDAEEVADATETRRRAVACLLLRAGGVVRLVRAVAAAGGQAVPGFEVALTDPDCTAAAHAFAALSVACRLAAPAASVLSRDEAVARIYLAQAGAAMSAALMTNNP